MKLRTEGDPIVAQVSKSLQRLNEQMSRRMRNAMNNAAQEMLDRGRADIKSAGNFGARWTDGLTVDKDLDDEKRISITLREAVPYWSVFQYGKTIKGKPLLWIVLPGHTAEERGDFFQTSKKGNLILFRKDGSGPGNLTPIRVAKPSVYIPKKFHLLEIARDVASKLGALYRKNV